MLEAGIIQYANSLAILLGLYPSDLQKIMETDASLPEYIEPVGVGYRQTCCYAVRMYVRQNGRSMRLPPRSGPLSPIGGRKYS